MNIVCPKCMGNDITPVGTSHYVCNNPDCIENGKHTQFKIVEDTKIKFPYNQMYINRGKQNFYRNMYI